MKVKASTVKRRTNTGMSAYDNSKPTGKENLTITARIKRPDVVRQVAESHNKRPTTATDIRKRNTSTNTKPRQKAYVPGGRKNNTTVYWVLGGLGAFCTLMLIAVIIAVSGGSKEPQRVTSNPTTPTVRKKKASNVRYGPGSWADDPEVRAAIEGSTLYQNRQNAKKNYKKNK